ncbi:T9SS type A sorting domain-containing protein [Chryseobacterium joostei]|uniref:T9SS type A sorting domain-containing protein n=1 Tax=Chryseobacterium joostei TaxID=112234 RepID=UPI003D0B8587
MIESKSKLWILFLMLPVLSFSQNYQWQWAKQAGGQTGSNSAFFDYLYDESIRDIAVDNNNNTYYLASIWAQGQNLNGVPVTSYGLRDLLLFSTDCQGNIRWSRTIGGSGYNEFAWNIEVDNNGGLYIMGYFINQSNMGDPNAVPIHFDDTHTMPLITATDQNTVEAGNKTSHLLKFNTSDGKLAWSKPLQGDVTIALRQTVTQMMYMDSSKNIHAILGFKAGTHLNGLITVPASYTSSYQYYLVKFNYDNGNMTPATPLLLPITGDLSVGIADGKVNLMYDEGLNRYYLAGKRMYGDYTNVMANLSYNNIPFTKDAYLLAFNGATGTELWRKEFDTGITILDDEIHSIIKDISSSDIYISGRYFAGTTAATFGEYTLPLPNYQEQVPFVMRLTADGVVKWAKIPDGITSFTGYRFMKGMIALNGNEVAFAKGSWNDVWGTYSMTRPNTDLSDPLLVRLNKDTGAFIGAEEIRSNFGVQDEFTAIAVDKDGNYLLGGFFHNELFTDANDGVNTMAVNVTGGKSQSFFAKYAKSACSLSVVETSSSQAGIEVYPNPVQDVLYIQSKEPLVSYEIYGATGQSVKQGTLSMAQEQLVLSSLSTGVYYIKLKTKSATVTEKIMKK